MVATDQLVLWRHPITTLLFFAKSLYYYSVVGLSKLKENGKHVTIAAVTTAFILMFAWKKALWCAYWFTLGVLSSVGWGTGLHTFVLYLGPHIASVTLAAYECNSLAFPSPPYPDEIICPDGEGDGLVDYWKILDKVRVESMLWGLGTALGELTPYFLARAARLGRTLAGHNVPIIDENNETKFSIVKKFVINMIGKKSQFFVILALASVPNPLFDFAGMMCGHFLVPFWSFFAPTLIGKALIKTHLQILFVIAVFNESYLETCLAWIAKYIPVIGAKFQTPIRDLIESKKNQFKNPHLETNGSVLGWIFSNIGIVFVVYFVISIVNSLAQSQQQRERKKFET